MVYMGSFNETFPVILMTKPLNIHHRKNKQSLIAISTDIHNKVKYEEILEVSDTAQYLIDIKCKTKQDNIQTYHNMYSIRHRYQPSYLLFSKQGSHV